jgi:hypothetical protein
VVVLRDDAVSEAVSESPAARKARPGVPLRPAGTFTSLYSFASPGPAFPYAGLVQGGDGMFYGAAYGGGANIQGALYQRPTRARYARERDDPA